MAHVTSNIQQTIDQWIEYLTGAWEQLPQAVRTIDQWDLPEQIDYIEEWAPKEELAGQLQRLIALPEATDEQRARFWRLQELMHEYRETLSRLRAG
jgi:hypothetical protein